MKRAVQYGKCFTPTMRVWYRGQQKRYGKDDDDRWWVQVCEAFGMIVSEQKTEIYHAYACCAKFTGRW